MRCYAEKIMQKDLWEYLKSTGKPVVLYGMGNGADKIVKVLESYGVSISGVFATDGFVRKKLVHGFEMTDYDTLKKKLPDMIVLVTFGTSRPEVIEGIKKIAGEGELYSPDVPVYGDLLFNNEYLSANKENFHKIYSLLADEKSKQVYENIIRYKLSGKIEYLSGCETSPQEAYKNILHLSDDETFLDLGAYNGDTIAEFAENVNNYRKIYGVEPDKKTFLKLCKNTEKFDNIELFNICVSDIPEIIGFSMSSGRNSSVSHNGQNINADSVDNILQGKMVSFIKMDVEGQELKAIAGSYNTIKSFKPKMLISAYHRSDDLISIPLEIMKIRSDYKIYIRHYPYIPGWDTNFYFV